jgi:hypothetical protein
MVRAPVMNLSTRERVCPVIQAALRTAKEGDRSNVLGFRGASATVVPEAMWHLPLVLPVWVLMVAGGTVFTGYSGGCGSGSPEPARDSLYG